MGEERAIMHVCSAFVAGFTAVTITNPIWFVKTRLQLDEARRGMSTAQMINKIMKDKGPLGFYKGISASYFGIIESAMYFALYEKLKSLSKNQFKSESDENLRFIGYFTSAGFSKSLASCICYPHGKFWKIMNKIYNKFYKKNYNKIQTLERLILKIDI